MEAYTTFQIAKMLGVTPNTVATWIDEGRIKAYTTLGGHRRVKREDLLHFLREHRMPVPAELEGRKTILVVEDDPQVLDVIVDILKEKNTSYAVEVARDGFEAGESFSVHRPDVVILDLMLPGIDGFRVCEKMREKSKTVRILAITGYPTRENRERILKCGANGFLAKPFSVEELEKNMERLTRE